MDAVYVVDYTKTIAIDKETKTWQNINIEGKPLSGLTELYHEIEIALFDVVGHPKTLRLSRHYASTIHYNNTIEAYLETLTGKIIPGLTDGHPVLNTGSTFMLNLAGMVSCAMCPRGVHPTQDFALDDANDVTVDSEYIDAINKQLLYNVNGSWVHSQYDGEFIRLYNAGNIIHKSLNFNISALNFRDVGDVKTKLLNTLDIEMIRDDVPHYNNALIVDTGEDLTDKTVALVLGGILIELPTVQYVGVTTVTVPLGKLRIPDIILSTRDVIDWDKDEIIDLSDNFKPERLYSAEVLKLLIAHESSFIVVIDRPNVRIVREEGLQKLKVGHFKYPINSNLGFIADNVRRAVSYYPIQAGKYWDLYFREPDGVEYIMQTTGWEKDNTATVESQLLDPYRKLSYCMYNFTTRVPPYTE